MSVVASSGDMAASLPGAAIGDQPTDRSRTELGSLLKALGVRIEVVAQDDAETAAVLAGTNPTLSLGDRFCLAVAERLGLPAYTADRAWRKAVTAAQVVDIR
jgi:PIN domain nuclease of toxin-antitoxin system